MDPRVAKIAMLNEKERRARAARLPVAAISLVYLAAVIAVLSQMRTPLPGWVWSMIMVVPVLGVAVFILRYRPGWLQLKASALEAAITDDKVAELHVMLGELQEELQEELPAVEPPIGSAPVESAPARPNENPVILPPLGNSPWESPSERRESS